LLARSGSAAGAGRDLATGWSFPVISVTWTSDLYAPRQGARHVILIEQFRYVRLGTGNLPAAVDFAQRILGLQLIERSEEQATFRSDFRDHTLVYEAGAPAQQSIGLEVRSEAALESAVAALATHGITATAADAIALRRRKARAMASFRDR